MKLIRDLAAFPAELRSGAAAIGNFDGVHIGHARIVERLLAQARELGGPALVFTFDPHPVRILRPSEAPPPLTWTDRKAELLARLGVDAMIAFPADDEFLQLSAAKFFDSIVLDRLAARGLVEGPNFFFGHDRAGTIDLLRQLTATAGISLEVVPPVIVDGDYVSSSRVRRLLAEGRVEQARAMLTEPYRIRGMVVHGAGRGAKLGFPTANVTAIDTLLPGPGVYAGRALIDAQPWPAAINVGPNPTFADQAFKVEVHAIGWREPLYGQPLEVDFLARLRDIQRFDNVDLLQRQLHDDVAAATLIGEEEIRRAALSGKVRDAR